MTCDFLRWANWRIHWLSSNEQAVAAEVVGRLRPDALLLSIGLDSSVVAAARLIEHLRRRHDFAGLIAVGGQAVNADPSLVGRIGADLTAPDGGALVHVLRPRFKNMGSRPHADREASWG